jgi:C4-dicarboxylate-specific signal transduction histidine kinase
VQLAGHTTQSVLEFQLLMLALAITGLFLGMAVSQWRHASQTLQTREAELNRAMRVAAAAEMTSALAHELNQPLTAASNYLQACDIMLARDSPPSADLAITVRKAYAEVERTGDVVRRLRDFYRGGQARREPAAVAEILADSIKPLRARIERHGVRMIEGVAHAPRVAVDRGQISMVLHNLIANAIDSLATSGQPGEIAVEAAAEGLMVRLTVHDTGGGIAPSIADQLFQTFATSKPDGMGLGLAISRSIVESHGGRLWLEPSERGARFAMTLPAAA